MTSGSSVVLDSVQAEIWGRYAVFAVFMYLTARHWLELIRNNTISLFCSDSLQESWFQLS